MKKFSYETEEDWQEGRRGKVTGSKLGGIVTLRGDGKKIGYWQLLADRLSTAPDEEYPMDRGHRLEKEAIARFTQETKIEVDTSLVILTRDEDENIAVSPDGLIGETEAVEVKCLKSAKHLEAYFTQKIPSEYYFQTLQYFIVNDGLEMLHFVFYDPRVLVKDYFVIEVMREDIQEDIDKYLAYQQTTLTEINEMVNKLTFDNL